MFGVPPKLLILYPTVGAGILKPGDEVLITMMEHHANIVPWQMVCAATGAVLRAVPILQTGELDWDAFTSMINEKTRMVAVTGVSNALGTVNDIKRVVQLAKRPGL